MLKLLLLALFIFPFTESEMTIRNPREYFTIDVEMSKNSEYKYKLTSPTVEICLKAQTYMSTNMDYHNISASFWRVVWRMNDTVTKMSSYRSDGYDLLQNLTNAGDDVYNKYKAKFENGDYPADQKLNPHLIDILDFMLIRDDSRFLFNKAKIDLLLEEVQAQKKNYFTLYSEDVKVHNKYKQDKIDEINETIDFAKMLSDWQKSDFNDARIKLRMHMKIIEDSLNNSPFVQKMKAHFDVFTELKTRVYMLETFYMHSEGVEEMKEFVRKTFKRPGPIIATIDDTVAVYKKKDALEKMQERLNVIVKMMIESQGEVSDSDHKIELVNTELETDILSYQQRERERREIEQNQSRFKKIFTNRLKKSPVEEAPTNEDSSLKEIKKKVKKVKTELNTQESELDTNIDALKSSFNIGVEEMKVKLNRIEGYSQYVTSVKKIVSKMNRIQVAIANCETMETLIFDEQTRINSFQKNIDIEKSYFYDNIRIKKNSEDNTEAAKAFVVAGDTASKIYDRMKNLTTMNQRYRYTTNRMMSKDMKKLVNWFVPEHFGDAVAHVDSFLVRYLKQLALVENINKLESKVDRELAKVFAYLNNNIDMFKCFSKQDLAFMFFKMIKTNMIVNERDFINTYLKQLNYKDQMEFILYNYSIVANNKFMTDLQGRYDFKRKPLFEKLFARQMRLKFVEDYCMLINLYKDLTRFRTDSMDSLKGKVSRKRRFMNSILGKFPVKKLFKNGYQFVIKQIVKAILKCIPFIGNIPALTGFLTEVISYLIYYLIDVIVKAYKNSIAARNAVKAMKEGFKNFFNKDIISLNYQDHIQTKLNEEPDSDLDSNLNIKSDQVEKMFYKGLKSKDPANFDDMFFSMKNYFYMITPTDINRNPRAVLQVISAAKQNTNDEFFQEDFYPANITLAEGASKENGEWYTKRIFGVNGITVPDDESGQQNTDKTNPLGSQQQNLNSIPETDVNPNENLGGSPQNQLIDERRLKDVRKRRDKKRYEDERANDDEYEYRHTIGDYAKKSKRSIFYGLYRESLE